MATLRRHVARPTRERPGPEPPSPAAASRAPVKKPASRPRTLSVEALEQLGARRLAGLLMEQANADPAMARSLRLALAGTESGGRLAAEVEKRLRTLRRSKGFIAWDKVRPLARELENLRQTIAGPLAEADPKVAVAQMRLLLDLAEGIFERSDDGSGTLGEVFRAAGAELGRLWTLIPSRNPAQLAHELLALLDADGYGVTDRLLAAAGPALGADGRAELRRLLQARLAGRPSTRGRDEIADGRSRFMVSLRLRELADLEDDVDAFIAAVETGGRAENFSADVAERLIAHGRPAEALAWLERTITRHDEGQHVALRIAALDALGRHDKAQALRWAAFEQWLAADHLRAYLRGLPDFEDVEAEDGAIAHALSYPDRNLALAFLIEWPNHAAANRLVRFQHSELNGRDYGRLRPAAEAMVENYPAAATLLHRLLAEDVLRRASSRQYPYAVRDVRACAALALLLPEEDGLETYDVFMARLRREHPRKAGFWSLLDPAERQ